MPMKKSQVASDMAAWAKAYTKTGYRVQRSAYRGAVS